MGDFTFPACGGYFARSENRMGNKKKKICMILFTCKSNTYKLSE